ncbi:Glu/Leu/Phe/Val dehydrogenase, partial [Klebsiella pneumoniae]|nr:Glu/Leu/Phe/Val dehydrogenase [Klebsiella pneumoniae]
VQGFGNVGSEAALLFMENGSKVICVQDHSATLYQEQGIDIKKLLEYSNTHHKIQGFSANDEVSASAFWTMPAEVFIPAALEG